MLEKFDLNAPLPIDHGDHGAAREEKARAMLGLKQLESRKDNNIKSIEEEL